MATTNGVPQRQFPVGAVVRLNSGGPRLTVTAHLSSGENEVAWITGSSFSEPKRSHFPDATIYLAPPPWRVPLIVGALACGSLLAFIAGHAAFAH